MIGRQGETVPLLAIGPGTVAATEEQQGPECKRGLPQTNLQKEAQKLLSCIAKNRLSFRGPETDEPGTAIPSTCSVWQPLVQEVVRLDVLAGPATGIL